MLNGVGYGQPGSGLPLDLVYNPGGVFLAPPQDKLQPAYKQVGWGWGWGRGWDGAEHAGTAMHGVPRCAGWLLRWSSLSATLYAPLQPPAVVST